MKKENISEVVGIFVALGGLTVMTGWIFGIEVLKSILPVWVSMKFSTALSFSLSGILLYFVARFRKKDREWAIVVLPVLSMTVFLFMGSLLASTVAGTSVGVEELFVRDSMTADGNVTPGRPSIVTMLNFILTGMIGILTIMNFERWDRTQEIFGLIFVMTGSIATLGYIGNWPVLYFMVPGICSAMGLHTAILFGFLGAGFLLTKGRK